MAEMIKTTLNGKYEIILPKHRAERPDWHKPPYWEYERIESMMANLKPTDNVFYIGAEEGEIPAIMAKEMTKGTMVMFEPNPKVVPNTKAIWDANKLKQPIFFVGFASSQTRFPNPMPDELLLEDGWPKCAYGPVIGDHGFRNLDENGEEEPILPEIKLDDFMAEYEIIPNIITMDVEGSEFEILKGAAGLIEEYRPLLWISIHPEFMYQHYNQYGSELMQYMKAMGYKFKLLDYNHEVHAAFWHPEGRNLID